MGDPILDALNRKIGNVQTAPTAAPDMHSITAQAESGGRDFTSDGRVVTSRTGAKGSMQVMDGTNQSPGFGVTPARNGMGRRDDRTAGGPQDARNPEGPRYVGPNVPGLQTFAEGVNDLYTGVGEGWNNFQNSLVGLGTRATDAVGLTTGAHDGFNTAMHIAKQGDDNAYVRPDGWNRSIGNFIGEATPTAPVGEIKVLDALGPGTKLAKALAKYGDFAVQGAAGGVLNSGGDNIALKAAEGALAAPAVGAVAEHVVAPIASNLWNAGSGATEKAGSRLAQAMKKFSTEEETVPVARGMVGEGAEAASHQLPTLSPEQSHGFPLADAEGRPLVGVVDNGAGGFAPQYGMTPQEAAGGAVGNTVAATDGTTAGSSTTGNARGAAGARRGIESVPYLPQQVAGDVQTLTGQGVPDDQALNEAAVKYVGGKPTVGSTTRDFETMQTEQELAKEAGTSEGRALRQRHAENNAALHGAAQDTVTNYGGVPAQGEAAETVAGSLADASNAAKTKVDQAYKDARAQDGDKRVSIDGLRELLDKPNFRAPTTVEGKQLVLGLRAQIDEMTRQNRGRFTPDEIDALWKEANRAYSPMGKGANAMIDDVKKALGESLDQFDAAGPGYKAARAAHRQWAEQYADPEGVANLIERNAKGDFVNGDNWRKTENGLVGTTSDKGFVQVVRQLQKNGDTAALNRLKADIVQRAYEAATKGNADHFGNPRFTAKAWEEALNRIGLPKLQAIFSPEELGHLSIIGHAARALNEPVPGAVNGSGTSSGLVNAARRVKDGAQISPAARNVARALRGAGHIGATVLMPGKGNLMVEGVSSVAEKVGKAQAEHSAGKALAAGIRKTMDPAKTRQMDEAEMQRTIQRLELAKALSKQAGAASAAATSDTRK